MSLSHAIRISTVCLLAAVAAGACDEPLGLQEDPDAPTTSQLSVLLTDAPSDMLDSALVYIAQVYLQGDGGRVVISETPTVFELLSLRNGVTAEMGAADLPPGAYSELRLVVDSARAVLRPGLTFQDGSSSAAPRTRAVSTARSSGLL